MRKQKFKLIFLFFAIVTVGCKDNPVENKETLVFRLDGVIESLSGDCAGVQVRTRSFGNLDLINTQKVKFNFSGMSDADLSSVSIYYILNDEPVYLINLPDRDQINATNSIEVNSPGINAELFLRVTLKSSVCTGQIFFLTFSDLKIYSK
ncbi:MAG: hypothetical protein ABI840_01015 [bacterium]